MAVMTTYTTPYNVSRQVFLPAYTQREGIYSWPWETIYTVGTTDHATEQVFSYAGVGAPKATGELEPIKYSNLTELERTVFTPVKYTLAIMASQEAIEDGHYYNIIRDGAESIADGFNYMVDYNAALPFNRAFNTDYTMYDGSCLCTTHTLAGGGTLNNSLTAASINYDNLWLARNYFDSTLVRHDGLPLVDKAKYLVHNPAKNKVVDTVLQADRVPGTANNDKAIGVTDLISIPCRYLSTNYWFLLGERAKSDLLMFWRIRKEVKQDSDFDRDGIKLKARIRFIHGVRDFFRIVGNPGA